MSVDDAVSAILGDWYARGAREDVEALVRQHPDLEPELRAALRAGEEVDLALGAVPRPWEGAGRTLGGYRLVREIGRGGMGIVFEAQQIALRRRVALKILHPAVAPSREAVDRFRREARAAARLVHPHLVAVHEMGEVDGVVYYAMEWVQGTTLAQVVADRRRARARGERVAPTALGSPADGIAYHRRLAAAVSHVADALHVAHEAGIVHRDVKPANLILDGSGALRVMDFGVARVDGDVSGTLTGALVGTPAYMSPEQAGGGHFPVDARADVYSLGASLYEVLTLRPPFEGGDPYSVCLQVLSKVPVRPRRRDPSIPRDLESIVRKAMERCPDRRYASAKALAEDLRSFADGGTIRGRRRDRLPRAGRAVLRPSTLAALGVLAILVAIGVATRRPPGSAGPSERVVGDSRWVSVAPIPVASYGLGAAVLDGRLYAISGYFTSRVAVHDPRTRSWSSVAPLPRPIQYAGVAVAHGRLHVFGGDTGGWGALATTYTYDPTADSWTARAPMPGGARYGVGAAEIGGKIYVVGGLSPAAVGRLEVFDPVSGTWETRRPLPHPRALWGAAGALGGRLYVLGDEGASDGPTRMDVYDPLTDGWTTKEGPPIPITAQAVAVEGRLVLAGGGRTGDERDVLAYDPTADAWTPLPRLREGRHSHGVAYDSASRVLYAVSGAFGSTWLTSVESWTPPPER